MAKRFLYLCLILSGAIVYSSSELSKPVKHTPNVIAVKIQTSGPIGYYLKNDVHFDERVTIYFSDGDSTTY